MTIRDIAIAIGFEIDKSSEKKASGLIKNLANSAKKSLNKLPVGFSVDNKTAANAVKITEKIKIAANPLKQNKVGFNVDKTSQNQALQQVKTLRAKVASILGTIGLGFIGISGIINLGKKFLQESEIMQGAMQTIREMWQGFLAEMDEAHELTKMLGNLTRRIASGMIAGFNRVLRVLRTLINGFMTIAEKVGGVQNLLKLLAIIASSLFLAFNFPAILGFLRGIGQMLGMIKLKMLPIIAVIVLLGLLVDDFITFMRGGDSVIGTILAKFGIGADDVKAKIKTLVETAKTLISQAVQVVRNVISSVWTWLVAFWEQHGDRIIGFVQAAWQKIQTIISMLANFWQQNSDKIIGFIQTAWAKISATVQTAWQFVQTVISALVAFWQQNGDQIIARTIGYAKQIWASVYPMLKAVWDFTRLLVGQVKTFLGWLQNTVATKIGELVAFWQQHGADIITWFSGFVERIVNMFTFLVDMITAIFNIFSALFSGDWDALWEGVKELFAASWNFIKEIFAQVVDNLILIFAMLFGKSVADVKNWFNKIKSWFTKAANFIKSMIDKIVKFFQPFIDIIGTVTDFVGSGLSKAADFIGGLFGSDSNSSNSGISPIEGFAKGTNSTPDTFIAGENGAELITGAKGRKVLNNKETANILTNLASGANFIKQAANTLRAITIPPNPANTPFYGNIENKIININMKNEMNNEFKGDRASQQADFKAFGKVAQTDIMGELSRALAYAR
ncbi:MAG: hypothetical protein FWG64_05525 [Firmicutes bacterium]|nr:hypothetical protein [Bacillota bacterium]